MIPIGTIEFITDSEGLAQINEKVTQHTCKTNLNPQLMFRQSYTGLTKKLFVGNWTREGFWISKYRFQLYQFRPDIISRFYIGKDASNVKVTMKFSIGFSSILVGLILIMLFSSAFTASGPNGFLIAVGILTSLYICLASIEYDKMLKAIKNNILDGITRTKSSLDSI